MNNNRATLAGKYEERKAYMSMHTYIHKYVHKCTHDNRSRKFRLLEKVNSTLALRGIEIANLITCKSGRMCPWQHCDKFTGKKILNSINIPNITLFRRVILIRNESTALVYDPVSTTI